MNEWNVLVHSAHRRPPSAPFPGCTPSFNRVKIRVAFPDSGHAHQRSTCVYFVCTLFSMASPFKIPKKKRPTGSDSAPLHTSPLARLQSSGPAFKSYGDQSSRGRADRMHAGSSQGSSGNSQSAPIFRNVVKTLLGLNGSNRGASAANHRGASAANHRGVWSHQSESGQRAESSSTSFSNGWRPKRASDRLLPPDVTPDCPSPPQKKKSDLTASATRRLSVDSLDSLAGLRGEWHAGSLSSSALRETPLGRCGSAERKHQEKKNSSSSGSDQTSEDDFVSPARDTPSVISPRRRSLDRRAWLSKQMDDVREKERKRWREFSGRKTSGLRLYLKKPRSTPTEPIVLSSEEEEEEEEEDEGDRGNRTSQSRVEEATTSKGEEDENNLPLPALLPPPPPPPPPFLQLDFVSLHAGLTHADANGKMMINENGLIVPLKGVEDGEIALVASQVRGYGVCDGGVVQGGALLAGWEGPAPSLLFLWVTDAQANLLQRELSSIQTPTSGTLGNQEPGPACSFLLLVLKEQLQELQAALLASIMDMEEYRKGCSSSGGPTSPLEWTDGLLLLHSCPPPLDQHLLQLLGHSAVRNNQKNKKSQPNSSGLQQLPTRLIQYPAAPCKGRITVTKEDLACLSGGEFLNDVIIDFYLKFLLLEGVGGSVAERSHVFSSFFYKQLSRRRAAGDDGAPSVPDRHMRHQRVKTWTRHVDIFTKDFLFVPVNQEAHWFLVVICFPGLEEVQYQEFQSLTGGATLPAGKPSSLSLRSQQLPECTQRSWQRDTVLKRPCVLVMDSLKLSYHENICRLLRDYLQVEWEVHRGTPRLFTADSVRSSSCRVPQQDNSSDCGLYLLQYAESFLQNPVVHFDLPLRLDNWFPRQRVRQKREEIRTLIMKMHQSQKGGN
ncbi:sentrin-specific protease 7-like isoform X4 [Cyclopterus lumpus]|uniref:sentrin-specific protease 7-like isoform X4 n=1 Tax=Cyclopterus lumpus TaxID=8103 RepID=UPI00148637F3|nr:sentrin-specific protease 7-like isoform X4 [Cyclopterus lumpus]